MSSFRSPHFWIITILTLFLSSLYYGEQFNISSWTFFGAGVFGEEYIHDVHRSLFFIPMLYAAIKFRLAGAMLISLAMCCVVLPRALFFSPHPDSIFRAVVFVIVATLASVLLARERNASEEEHKASRELIVTHRDLQDRSKLLASSERRYRDLFESASEAIIIGDFEVNIVEANQAAAALFGYPLEQLIGMNMRHLLTADSFEAVKQRLQHQIGGETISSRAEVQTVMNDGTKVIIDIVTRIIFVGAEPTAFQMIARDVTEERKSRDSMQFYISEITRAQENERHRIARELHDETAQELASLALSIEATTRMKGLTEETIKHLDELREKVEEIMEGVHRFSQDLRPGILSELGLLPALEWLTEEMSVTFGIDASVEIVGTERRLQSEIELVLFRIAQEALSNVRKHSMATKTVVRLRFAPQMVILDIIDNGTGFELPERWGDFASVGRLGIVGMQERARIIGGNFSVQSELGKGTTFTAEVPV